MIRKKREIFAQINRILDGFLLGFALWLSYFLRTQNIVNFDLLNQIPPFSENVWMLAILVPLGPVFLNFYGFYTHQQLPNLPQRINQIFKAGTLLVLVIGLCVIFLRVYVPSRSLLILLLLIAPLLLLLRNWASEIYYRNAVRHGNFRESVIFAGEPSAIRELVNKLPASVLQEIQILAEVDLESLSVDSLVEQIHEHAVGRVVLCFHKMNVDCMQQAINSCELEGIEVWLDANFIRTSIAQPTYDYLSSQPMLVFRNTPEVSWAFFVKALMDRFVAAAAILLLAPFLLLIAAIIKWTSRGPVLFRQTRAGLHGKKFTMFKFRSMVPDAETIKSQLDEYNEMDGPVFKMTEDPRVTPFGKFIRRTSIDELPQLWNVLRGEMSLVGPRPLPDYEVKKFDKFSYRRRLSMKPGLTCLWQIRGRNKVTNFDEWIAMDLEYIDNWSLEFDFVILLKTIPVVLFGWGAK